MDLLDIRYPQLVDNIVFLVGVIVVWFVIGREIDLKDQRPSRSGASRLRIAADIACIGLGVFVFAGFWFWPDAFYPAFPVETSIFAALHILWGTIIIVYCAINLWRTAHLQAEVVGRPDELLG